MISIIPALQFMQSLVGDYHDDHAKGPQVLIRACGYGQLFEYRNAGKIQMAGVIGANGGDIELCAQIGLPNIVRFDGQLLSDSTVLFEARDTPIQLELRRTPPGVDLLLLFNGSKKAEHRLVRVP